MTPYYEQDNITIYHGDCAVIAPQLPDYDLLLTDPPYGIGRDGSKQSTGSHGGRKAYEFMGWDQERPPRWLIEMLLAKTRHQIIGDCAELNTNPQQAVKRSRQGGVLGVLVALLLVGFGDFVLVVRSSEGRTGAGHPYGGISLQVMTTKHVVVFNPSPYSERRCASDEGRVGIGGKHLVHQIEVDLNLLARSNGYGGKVDPPLSLFWVTQKHTVREVQRWSVSKVPEQQGDFGIQPRASGGAGWHLPNGFLPFNRRALYQEQRGLGGLVRFSGSPEAQFRVVEQYQGNGQANASHDRLDHGVAGLAVCGEGRSVVRLIFGLLLVAALGAAGLISAINRRQYLLAGLVLVGIGGASALVYRWALAVWC